MNRTLGNRPGGLVAVFMAGLLCLWVGLRALAANDASSPQAGEVMFPSLGSSIAGSDVEAAAGSAAAPPAGSAVAPALGVDVSGNEGAAGAPTDGPTHATMERNRPPVKRAGNGIPPGFKVIEGDINASTDGGGVAGVAVSNVTASQRTDGTHRVDIRYDLSGPSGDAFTISVQVSDNGGSAWTVPVQSSSLSGDAGSGVMPGTGKHIVWDCAADLPGANGAQFKFRVCANGGTTPGGEMVLIPAGEFEMGDHHDGGVCCGTLPLHAVHIDAFYMDRFEVTNQQYADALNWAWAQGNLITVTGGVVYKFNSGTSYPYCYTTTASSYSRITWNGSVFGVVGQALPPGDPGNKTNHPMVMVSWYGAAAYANWRSAVEGRTPSYDTTTWECNFAAAGYRLPTEAEWEKAARGGNQSPYYRYPWGDSIDESKANYWSSGDPYESGNYPWTTPVGYYNGSQTPPGTDMANGYGLYDMSGNVWEWCNDWWGDSYYASSPYSNPTGPASGSYRVLRGGSWYYYGYTLRCAYRYYIYPDYSWDYLGFRLALD